MSPKRWLQDNTQPETKGGNRHGGNVGTGQLSGCHGDVQWDGRVVWQV
jgi:hypothetical protein